MRPWIALFSQTGTEIANVSTYLKTFPSLLVTTRKDLEGTNEGLQFFVKYKNVPIIYLQKNTTVKDYNNIFSKFKKPLITLHGFLRIIPADICNKYEIYNLHPGLITKYPELKGKDPQERAWQMKHPTAGCVIHKVIPEVDEGEILLSHEVDIRHNNRDKIYEDLHSLGSVLWCQFLQNYVKPGDNQDDRNTVSGNLSGVP